MPRYRGAGCISMYLKVKTVQIVWPLQPSLCGPTAGPGPLEACVGGTHLCSRCFNTNREHSTPGSPGDRCVSSRSQECPLKSLPVYAGPCSCPTLGLPGFRCDAVSRNRHLAGLQRGAVAWSSPATSSSSVSPKAFGEGTLFLQNVPSQ